jgi:PiT family inorganic phosphate transporter
MIPLVALLAVVCLAYANGANDNSKGVATLLGSGTASYGRALLWASVTTFLGSLTAVFLAEQLLKNFSGRGLVADQLVDTPVYLAAVALGAGLTVLLATRLGLPVSTTHALVGGLVGAGYTAGSAVDLERLANSFFVPLLFSPILALVATSLCYLTLHRLRLRLGIARQTCFCAGLEVIEAVPAVTHAVALERVEHLTITVGTPVTCRDRYVGRLVGIELGGLLDRLHYLSAGIVSFARGLNDTPKIAALLLILPAFGKFGCTLTVGVAMMLGGLLAARRVAELMSRKITPMNHGQGFTANLLTGLIVIGASKLGLPVSTTHVSCGALFGIGTITGQADVRTIAKILAAWVVTLPLAVLMGAIAFALVSRL